MVMTMLTTTMASPSPYPALPISIPPTSKITNLKPPHPALLHLIPIPHPQHRLARRRVYGWLIICQDRMDRMAMDIWVAHYRSRTSRAAKKGYNYNYKNMRLTAFALRCHFINQANERIEMSHEDLCK